jgi:hypothetical protein
MTHHLKHAFVMLWFTHPKKAVALAACFVLLLIELYMNAAGGYEFAGGDWQAKAFGYGAISICIGVIASWAALQALEERGASAAGFWVLAVLCLAWSQSMGWSVMGVTLADGAVKRESAAMGRQSVADELTRKEAQLAALPVGRSLGAIDAELNLELRKTSRQFPDGDGPKAMKLKGEKADAELALALPAEIEALRARLAGAPQVAGGGSDVSVIAGAVDGVRQWRRGRPLEEAERTTPADVYFYRSIFVVLLIGLCATFGPAMILGRGAGKAEPAEPDWWFNPSVLPPQYRSRALPPPPDMPRDPPRDTTPGEYPALPPAYPGGSQGGPLVVNHLHGSASARGQNLPPRVAARRTAGVVRT